MKTHLTPFYAESYSSDPRKRRRQHRQMARRFRTEGGGRTFRSMEWWHLQQAKCLTYSGRL